MRRPLLLTAIPAALLGIAACVGEGSSSDEEGEPVPDAAFDDAPSVEDALAIDGAETSDARAGCDPSRPFTKPVRLSSVSTGRDDNFPHFTHARDELFVGRLVDGVSNFDAAVGPANGVVRYTVLDGGGWGEPTVLAFNDIGDGGKMHATSFSVTEDGKSGFLVGHDSANFSVGIRKVVRLAPHDPWSIPTPMTLTHEDSQPARPYSMFVNADATRLYYSANGVGGHFLFQADLVSGAYGPARLLGFDADERSPVLSRDELRIFFASSRVHPGGASGALVYTATRLGVDGGFGPIEFVAELNEGATEMIPSWLSADGCTMLLSGRIETDTYTDVFIATRAP